jgi:archaellum component FlaC
MCAETNVQFPGHIVEGGGVILNQIGTYYRINAFVDDSDLIKLLSSVIPDESGEDLDFEFEGHFDVPVVAVLFGLIDLARNHVRSQNDNLSAGDALVSSAREINDYLFRQWGITGFNDFITYIAAAGMKYEPPSLSDTIKALRSLTDAGVLTEKEGESYSLSSVLWPLVSLTTGDQAGLQWQRITQLESSELLWSNRIYVFGDGSPIILFSPTIEGRMFVSRVTKDQIIDFLTDEFTLPMFIEPLVTVTPGAPEEAVPLLSDLTEPVPSSLPPTPDVVTASAQTPGIESSTKSQLEATQRDIDACKSDLSKLEVRYKVGELSQKQYRESVNKLQARIDELVKTLEELTSELALPTFIAPSVTVTTGASEEAVPSPSERTEPAPSSLPTAPSTTDTGKTCGYCGKKNKPDVLVCRSCGMELKEPDVSVPPPAPDVVTTSPQTTGTDSSSKNQLEATQRDLDTCKSDLNKLEVRYKVGELSQKQYRDSVNKLQARIDELEKTLEELTGKM